jgi:hypothetical protein
LARGGEVTVVGVYGIVLLASMLAAGIYVAIEDEDLIMGLGAAFVTALVGLVFGFILFASLGALGVPL